MDSENSTLLKRYMRVMEIARDIASTLDLDALLNSIVHAAADVTNSAAASILLYDSANDQLHFQASTQLDMPLMRGLVVPVGNSIAGAIVSSRKPLIVDDLWKDSRHFSEVSKTAQFKAESLLGVPLITKDKVIGVLETLNKREGNFTTEDEELLTWLGAQAAVAIENARLFQQSDLIAEMVHELRTPLASISTASHLLMRPETSQFQRATMAETIYKETTRLSELATAFLDLARLESGRSPFQIEDVDLRQVLEECIQLVEGRIKEQGLKFNAAIAEALPSIRADRDKLKQATLNLLTNAIKYNRPQGHVTLTADSKGSEVWLSVEDTGQGIMAEHMEELFQRFYRVPGSERFAKGTGLGLSIVKKIVDAHGGKVEVESTVGVGTKFTIRLPIAHL